jgi:hypothetical protein
MHLNANGRSVYLPKHITIAEVLARLNQEQPRYIWTATTISPHETIIHRAPRRKRARRHAHQ